MMSKRSNACIKPNHVATDVSSVPPSEARVTFVTYPCIFAIFEVSNTAIVLRHTKSRGELTNGKTMLKTIVAGLVLTLCSLGQSIIPRADSPQGKLLALEKMWNQAQLSRDSTALEELVAERFVNTEWDGEVTNRNKFLADIRDPRFKPTAMSIE